MEKLIEERPLGKYERFYLNQVTTVKLLSIKSNSSLQYYSNREEFRKILTGEAEMILSNKAYLGKEGDEFFYSKKN